MKKILSFILGLFIVFLTCIFTPNIFAQNMGINASSECLMGVGKGCFDTDKIIGIRETSDNNMTVMTVLQDVILTATFLVGTVLTLVLIYCGLMFIIKPGNSKTRKEGMIKSGIGALLVRGAYSIVQVIQYIAEG